MTYFELLQSIKDKTNPKEVMYGGEVYKYKSSSYYKVDGVSLSEAMVHRFSDSGLTDSDVITVCDKPYFWLDDVEFLQAFLRINDFQLHHPDAIKVQSDEKFDILDVLVDGHTLAATISKPRFHEFKRDKEYKWDEIDTSLWKK